MTNKYRSDLSKAKNLGSAGSGAKHWWHQRLSAIILVLTTIWLVDFLYNLSNIPAEDFPAFFSQASVMIGCLLFVIIGFYHAALGMQVVIEDYVHNRAMRLMLLLGVQLFSIISVVSFVVALFSVISY